MNKSVVAWAVVKQNDDIGLFDVVYHSFAHTQAKAYSAASRVLSIPPYTKNQMHALGYVAKRVRISLAEDQ